MTQIVAPTGLLGEGLAEASPDLMRYLLQPVSRALPSADAVCGAERGRPRPPAAGREILAPLHAGYLGTLSATGSSAR